MNASIPGMRQKTYRCTDGTSFWTIATPSYMDRNFGRRELPSCAGRRWIYSASTAMALLRISEAPGSFGLLPVGR
jgi:hypothetical protein